ncbi:MAG: hypothetical protein DRP42_06975 [Tenericutes bacterium]|nr:MAG: hypothetical protein DRP42_06975 [Mycoplasmatota bacterium]
MTPEPQATNFQGILDQPRRQGRLDPDKILEDTIKESGTLTLARSDKKEGYPTSVYNFPKESLKDLSISLTKEGIPSYYAERELTDEEKYFRDLEFEKVYESRTDMDGGDLPDEHIGYTREWSDEDINAYNKFLEGDIKTIGGLSQGTFLNYQGNLLKKDVEFKPVDIEKLREYEEDVKLKEIYDKGNDGTTLYRRQFEEAYGKDIGDHRYFNQYKPILQSQSNMNAFTASLKDLYQSQQRAIDEVGIGNIYLRAGGDLRKELQKYIGRADTAYKKSVTDEVDKYNTERDERIQRASEALRSL